VAHAGVEVSATVQLDAPWDYSRPALRLERLLRRNAVAIQGVFALFWSLRLALVAGPWEVPIIVGVTMAVATRRAFRATSGLRARDEFRTAKGRAFLRPVTRLTLWQIAGSIALPLAASAVGVEGWGVPLVAITIGLFLVGFGRTLQLQLVRVIGAVATLAVVVVPFVSDGDARIAWTSTSMLLALSASAIVCARAAR
jgi:hypothetical protein